MVQGVEENWLFSQIFKMSAAVSLKLYTLNHKGADLLFEAGLLRGSAAGWKTVTDGKMS